MPGTLSLNPFESRPLPIYRGNNPPVEGPGTARSSRWDSGRGSNRRAIGSRWCRRRCRWRQFPGSVRAPRSRNTIATRTPTSRPPFPRLPGSVWPPSPLICEYKTGEWRALVRCGWCAGAGSGRIDPTPDHSGSGPITGRTHHLEVPGRRPSLKNPLPGQSSGSQTSPVLP